MKNSRDQLICIENVGLLRNFGGNPRCVHRMFWGVWLLRNLVNQSTFIVSCQADFMCTDQPSSPQKSWSKVMLLPKIIKLIFLTLFFTSYALSERKSVWNFEVFYFGNSLCLSYHVFKRQKELWKLVKLCWILLFPMRISGEQFSNRLC